VTFRPTDSPHECSVRGALIQIPGFGIRILQLNVSISRMEAFFAEPEIASHATLKQRASSKTLRLAGATLRHAGAEEGRNVLENVSIDFPEGELTVVSGPTGSGKSSRASFPGQLRRYALTDQPRQSSLVCSASLRSSLGRSSSRRQYRTQRSTLGSRA